MILPPPPKTETTIRPATLLRETLAGQTQGTYPSGAEIHYRQGDPHWHQTIAPLPTATPAPPFDPATLNLPPGHPRPKRFEPSATPPHPQTIASLLDPAQIAIRDFGTAIHRLFSRIRWLTDTDLETQIATWKATAPEDPQIIRDAETQFRHAITQPPIRAALTPPPTPCTLWLETPFTTRLSPSQYIGGRFDRVHIHPHRAEIFDYKSSLVDTPAQARHAAQTYHPQMALYRLALARLLNLPPPAITAHLLFTRTGQRITLTFQD